MVYRVRFGSAIVDQVEVDHWKSIQCLIRIYCTRLLAFGTSSPLTFLDLQHLDQHTLNDVIK